jgi:hypothetical protein
MLCVAVAVGTATVPVAQASRPVGVTITGQVTEVRGGDTILLGTKSYRVLPDSQAARALGRIHPGSVVDLVLNGEPGDAASRVILINPHEQP